VKPEIATNQRTQSAAGDFLQQEIDIFETVGERFFNEEMAAGTGGSQGVTGMQVSGRAYERDAAAFESRLYICHRRDIPAVCSFLAPVLAFVENNNIGDAEALQIAEMPLADRAATDDEKTPEFG